MNDFKKKIMDIIFEPDDPSGEVKAEAPLMDIDYFDVQEKPKEVVETIKRPKAKDILYKKQEEDFSFINYSEVPRKEDPKEEINEQVYEARENVSPIFGPIVQKERKKKTTSEKDIQKAINKGSNSDYVGIVLSPIYGYDTNKANDARKTLTNVIDTKKESIFEPMYEEEAFEIPDDMKETIQEAIEEAVIELTPKTNIENNYKEETNNVDEDVYENQVEDYSFEIEQGLEEELPNKGKEEQVKEETTEIKIPKFEKGDKKATRSIYDTAPIQLFDFDELAGNDKEKDLFDELIGDDD